MAIKAMIVEQMTPDGTLDPAHLQLASLADLSRDAAKAFPHRLAVKTYNAHGATEISYGDLNSRADRLAAFLVSSGKVQQRVAVAIGNRAEYIEAVLGIVRAGQVPVLLNIKLSAADLAYVIEDADCAAAIIDPLAAPQAIKAAAPLALRVVLGGGSDRCVAYEDALAVSAAVSLPDVDPQSVALQPYTSGSTGKPKGVLLGHAGQAWFTRMHAAYMRQVVSAPVPRGLLVVPMFHKNAWVGVIKPMLALGGGIIILDQFEPRRCLSILAEERVNYMAGVAALYAMMLKERDLIDGLDWSAFEAFFCGAAPAHREMLEEVEHRLGARAYHVYGLTEGGPGVMTHPADQPRGPLESCGKPNSSETHVRLVDAEGRDADFGELHVRSPGVALGYHNRPELTAERFRHGWLRTGDLMRRDTDGWYYFEGRTDDMFTCGGENIYPMEVERLLMTHPAVNLVSVVPLPHPVKGFAPAAMVQLKQGASADAEELREFTLAHGPAYAHPRKILIVDALPLAATDKIDRAAVARALAEGAAA